MLAGRWRSLVLVLVLRRAGPRLGRPVPEHAAADPARAAGPGSRPAVVLALVLAMVLSSGSLGYAAYLLNVEPQRHRQHLRFRPRLRAGRRPVQLPDDGRRRRSGPHGLPPGQPLGDQRGRQDRQHRHHLRAPQPPERPVQRRVPDAPGVPGRLQLRRRMPDQRHQHRGHQQTPATSTRVPRTRARRP